MRLGFRTLFLSSAILCATAAFAEPPERLEIPFSFTVQSKSFPAGYYNIGLELQQGVITLANEADSTDRIIFIAGPADRTKHSAVATFDVVGTDHVLHSLQIGRRVSRDLSSPDRQQASFPVSIAAR
ncbi:MAG TPA: hypothetical protein VK638_25170 [Edaphobacter sp.]|nr:hypothetical protein [Edaphobacter sp.]